MPCVITTPRIIAYYWDLFWAINGHCQVTYFYIFALFSTGLFTWFTGSRQVFLGILSHLNSHVASHVTCVRTLHDPPTSGSHSTTKWSPVAVCCSGTESMNLLGGFFEPLLRRFSHLLRCPREASPLLDLPRQSPAALNGVHNNLQCLLCGSQAPIYIASSGRDMMRCFHQVCVFR